MNPVVSGRKTLVVCYSRAQFLQNYLDNLTDGGVFIETGEFYNLGEPVEVVLDIEDAVDPVRIRGTVQWHRRPRTWRPDVPSGIAVGFDEGTEAQRKFLVNYCFGTMREKRRSGPRVVCDFPVRFFWNEVWCYGRAANVGWGGLFVLSDEVVPVGTVLELGMKPDRNNASVVSKVKVVRSLRGSDRMELGVEFHERKPLLDRTVELLFNQSPGVLAVAKVGKPFGLNEARSTGSFDR